MAVTATPNYSLGEGYAAGAAPLGSNFNPVTTITATPDYAAGQGYPAGGAPLGSSPAPSVGTSPGGSSAPTNSYAVVTGQPATNTINSIGTAYNGIKTGMANQTTANANNAVLPTIPGFTVSQTPTGAQGETQATNNATGGSYYITPQAKPATGADVVSALSGYGDQGTAGSQNPISTNPVAPTTTPSTTGTPNTVTATDGTQISTAGLPASAAAIVSQLATVNADSAQAYATFSSTIQQVINGTFPLTTAQQALIDSTNSAFNNMTKYLQLKGVALSSETGGISNKISASAGDLFSATQQQTAAVAKLEIGFQQTDYTQITDAYNEYTKAQEDVTTNLKDMFDTATTASQNAIANAQKQQELDQTQAQDEMTDKIALQGTYDHYVDANGNDVLYNNKTGQTVQAAGDSDVQVTADSTPGSTGIPVLDNNTETVDGIPYVNLANIKGTAAQEAAQKNAAIMGIPAISNTNAIAALTKIDTAQSDLTDVNAQIDSLLPKDATGRILGGAEGNTLQKFLQTSDPSGDVLAAFSTWRTSAVDILQALAGGSGSGLRINQAEINMSLQSDIPQVTDTVGVAMQKMADIQTQLNNATQGIVGDKVYNKYNPTPSISTANSLFTNLGFTNATGTSGLSSSDNSTFNGIASSSGL